MDKPQARANTVRPRSSHRKQRSPETDRSALTPVQDRSRRRNEQILEAAAKLLQETDIENLSHSDIADVALISKASVHYHYPTIAALQHELGMRYDMEVSRVLVAHFEEWGHQATTWQELSRSGIGRASEWFNNHRPACETLLGPTLTRGHRLAQIEYNSLVGRAALQAVQNNFVLPDLPGLEQAFAYSGEIIDLFWSHSYLAKGYIDDEALEESVRGSLGYLRNYIPEYLKRLTGDTAGAGE